MLVKGGVLTTDPQAINSEGQNSAIIGAGLTVQLTQKLLLSVDYDGQVGGTRYDSHAVVGVLRWNF
jgi:outer membrane autotransporter protein